jgi:hypothetical protein
MATKKAAVKKAPAKSIKVTMPAAGTVKDGKAARRQQIEAEPVSKRKAEILARKQKNMALWSHENRAKILADGVVDKNHLNMKFDFSPKEKEVLIPKVLTNLEKGWSLWKSVREVENCCSAPNFLRWVNADNGLAQRYAASRLKGYWMMAEDLQEIADNPHVGITVVTTENEWGFEEKVTKADMIEHRKLQTATRKWLLSKYLPRVFGEKAAEASKDPEALAAVLAEIAKKLPV